MPAAYSLGGLKIKSRRFGDMNLLYARFNTHSSRPSGLYMSVSDLNLDNPACPWEQTIISDQGNLNPPPNYQFLDFLAAWGFPNIAPFTMSQLAGSSVHVGSDNPNDVWEFSNGSVYYVYVVSSGNARGISLFETPQYNLSNQIRLTLQINTNIYPAFTLLSYNSGENKLQCVTYLMSYNGVSFRVNLSGSAPSTIPFELTPTQKEIDFYTGIPNDLPSDPYEPGGESDSGGGTGDFDGTSTPVDFASLPTLSAVDTGFISLYNPTLAQLQSLANYMWSDLFDLDTFKKLFGDPMQAILGLSIVPGPVPSGSAQVVKVGNISTGVTMTKAAAQYINIDCGTLNVEEFWGAYLDYEPYTKAEIYLPFIGVHQIAVDDIMNKPVHIMYHIDLLSGGCTCEIKCGDSVLYTFIGSCAVSIPVTGSDWTNLINGVLSAASAIGTMVATGGATAPAAAGEIASAAVNSLKPSIEKSGSIAGAGGLLAGKVPVLILTRPRQALPGRQNTFTGYPAFITRSLGALSGYTEVHSIRLSGIDGTESEIDEIEELLKGGVIL